MDRRQTNPNRRRRLEESGDEGRKVSGRVGFEHKSKSMAEGKEFNQLADIKSKRFIRGIGNRLSSDSSLNEQDYSLEESEKRIN